MFCIAEVTEINKAVLIEEIRKFNRFYTGILELLNHYYLDSGYSLAEARILFELNDLGPVRRTQSYRN